MLAIFNTFPFKLLAIYLCLNKMLYNVMADHNTHHTAICFKLLFQPESVTFFKHLVWSKLLFFLPWHSTCLQKVRCWIKDMGVDTICGYS